MQVYVYDVNVSEDGNFEFTTDIKESEKAVMLMVDFYRSIKKPINVLVYDKIKTIAKGIFKKF